MQPCSREMQASITSCLNPSQISLQGLQNGQQHQHQISNPQILAHNPHFDHPSHDDFLEQMFSNLPSWPDLPGNPKSPWDLKPNNSNNYQKLFNIPIVPSSSESRDLSEDQSDSQHDNIHYPFDESTMLASRLRQYQISENSPEEKSMMLQLIGRSSSSTPGAGYLPGDSGFLPLPLTLGSGDSSDTSFKSANQNGGGSVQGLFNRFTGSLPRTTHTVNQQHFNHPQAGSISTQNYGSPVTGMNQSPAGGSAGGGAAPARQRVRARRGQATDPHSIAERLRRERIAERMKALQELVPNANKTDKASMLDEIIDYVKFLQLQVKVLSMSRLGGAGAVAPLVTGISSDGGSDGFQASGDVIGRNSNGTLTASSSDSLTVTEHQVAKLMEEDMGSAMQYLQGKGLCLMPISLASAISTATCHSRNLSHHHNNPLLASTAGDRPSSPSMSALTVQSATLGNGAAGETSVKDVTSVSKA